MNIGDQRKMNLEGILREVSPIYMRYNDDVNNIEPVRYISIKTDTGLILVITLVGHEFVTFIDATIPLIEQITDGGKKWYKPKFVTSITLKNVTGRVYERKSFYYLGGNGNGEISVNIHQDKPTSLADESS